MQLYTNALWSKAARHTGLYYTLAYTRICGTSYKSHGDEISAGLCTQQVMYTISMYTMFKYINYTALVNIPPHR